MRTYSRKKKDEDGVAPSPFSSSSNSSGGLPPLSPPQAKKKSVWAGFAANLASKRTKKSPALAPSELARAAEFEDDGEDDDEQVFLDLSQQGSRVASCDYCRMRYSRGVASDESLHRRHCKRFRRGEKWSGRAGDEVVRTFVDGTRVTATRGAEDAGSRRVLEIVDMELGFAEEDAPGEGFAGRQPVLYVLVKDKRAVGAAVTVPVTKAFRVDSEHSADGIVQCRGEAEAARLGISRIWVHRDHRRLGYGERLLDCVLQHSGVARDAIAFSQPTQQGRKLAAKWFAREDFLVFKE